MDGLSCLFVFVLIISAGYFVATRYFGVKLFGGGRTRLFLQVGEGPAAHSHTVDLDKDGNGMSSATDGHRHPVAYFVVSEAAGHAHTLGPTERR